MDLIFFTNIINLNFIKGVEDSLPACGNDCIYRKESEGNEGQLYCFPTSYSDLQNKCDSENTRPKPCKINKSNFFLKQKLLSCSGWLLPMERVDEV